MKLHYSFFPLCAIFALCCACKQSPIFNTPNEWAFDTIRITKFEVPDSIENNAGFNVHINLVYATAGEDAGTFNDSLLNMCFIADSLKLDSNMSFKEKVNAELENFIKQCKKDYKDMCADSPNPFQFAYTLNIDGKLNETGDSTFAYLLNLETYLGGAHGSFITTVINLDKKSGKIFGVKDILKDGYEKPLTDAIVKNMAVQFGVNDLDDLKEMSIFEMEEPRPADFCICKKDTLTFIYNQYDIAPYCVGTIITSVPKNDIKDWLK